MTNAKISSWKLDEKENIYVILNELPVKSLLLTKVKGVTFLIGVDTSSNQVIGQCHPKEVIMTSHAPRSEASTGHWTRGLMPNQPTWTESRGNIKQTTVKDVRQTRGKDVRQTREEDSLCAVLKNVTKKKRLGAVNRDGRRRRDTQTQGVTWASSSENVTETICEPRIQSAA